MKQILIGFVMVIGLLGLSPLSGPRDVKDIEVVIVDGKAPQHPFQYEYEQMLYPTVRITSSSGTGSGVIISHRDRRGEYIYPDGSACSRR